ncbi:MAG TPA: nuclear transport factor 2 family protein [Oxalicibacterium sp.]|nr:nuclear transport factor 2 family protein [Oxalicibacterium sp.]
MSSEMTLAMEPEAQAAVHRAIDSWQQAATAGDLQRIMTHYAPDVLAFDAVSQLQFKGVEAYRAHWAACLEMCKGPMIFEIHELALTVRGDVSFAHYLTRCGGTAEDGQQKTSWMRATVCHRLIGGAWLIVHEHFSVPFDMQSGKAIFDLEPGGGGK